MNSDTKLIVGTIIGTGLLLLGAIYFLSSSSENNASETTTPQVQDVARDDQYNNKGASSENALVRFVEFSDFQCPACQATAPMLDQLVSEYPEKVSLTYRHFPLTTIHDNAEQAARAAEAAGQQGKFWEMHDLLFENQSDLSSENIKQFAQEIEGLDVNQWEQDWDSDDVKNKVEADTSKAYQLGLSGTPSIFINGVKINSSQVSYTNFKQIIDQFIQVEADRMQTATESADTATDSAETSETSEPATTQE